MNRKWMIRTTDNNIFGPVSKKKILELYKKKVIGLEDEVCSGNGYWFYIRENEYLNRYLIGNEIQSFNPISETVDSLDDQGNRLDSVIVDEDEKDITLVKSLDELKEAQQEPYIVEEPINPPKEDLEYPESSPSQNQSLETADDCLYPEQDDLAFPDEDEIGEVTQDDIVPPPPEKTQIISQDQYDLDSEDEFEEDTESDIELDLEEEDEDSQSNQRYIGLLLVAVLVALAVVLFLKRRLITNFLSMSVIPSAHAQVLIQKKKLYGIS